MSGHSRSNGIFFQHEGSLLRASQEVEENWMRLILPEDCLSAILVFSEVVMALDSVSHVGKGHGDR